MTKLPQTLSVQVEVISLASVAMVPLHEPSDDDDWFFGVAAIGTDGHESPVVFPGEAGAF